MKVSDIQNQIDAFILNTLARTDSSAQDLCSLLDDYLVQYRISLPTICSRLNALQDQHLVACLEEADPATSALFCLTCDDLPLFALDDGMLEDFADQNDVPLFDDPVEDDIYLLAASDDRWELHLMDEPLRLVLDDEPLDEEEPASEPIPQDEYIETDESVEEPIEEKLDEPIQSEEQSDEDLSPADQENEDQIPLKDDEEPVFYSDQSEDTSEEQLEEEPVQDAPQEEDAAEETPLAKGEQTQTEDVEGIQPPEQSAEVQEAQPAEEQEIQSEEELPQELEEYNDALVDEPSEAHEEQEDSDEPPFDEDIPSEESKEEPEGERCEEPEGEEPIDPQDEGEEDNPIEENVDETVESEADLSPADQQIGEEEEPQSESELESEEGQEENTEEDDSLGEPVEEIEDQEESAEDDLPWEEESDEPIEQPDAIEDAQPEEEEQIEPQIAEESVEVHAEDIDQKEAPAEEPIAEEPITEEPIDQEDSLDVVSPAEELDEAHEEALAEDQQDAAQEEPQEIIEEAQAVELDDDSAYDFTYGENAKSEPKEEPQSEEHIEQHEAKEEAIEQLAKEPQGDVVYQQISVFDEALSEPQEEQQTEEPKLEEPKEEPRKGKKKKDKNREIVEEEAQPEQGVMEPTPLEQQVAAEEAERRRVAMMRLGMLPGAEHHETEVDEPASTAQEDNSEPIPETPERAYYYDSMHKPNGQLEQYLNEAEVEHKFMYHSILYNVFRDMVQKPQVEDDNSEVGLVTSITELREEMRKKGYVVNQYVAQNTYQYYSKKYILVNKINLVTSLITYILGLAMVLIALFAVDPIVNWGWDKYVIAAVCLLVFPGYRLVSYLIYKDRHAPAEYSFKFSFATSWMAAIILMMIDLLIAFFIPIPGTSANISVVNSLIVPIFYPAALLLLLPIRSLIYFALYRTKRFHL